MAEVRGKFITLSCDLIKTKPQAREAAMAAVERMTGKNPYQLDPEGWYDTKVFDTVFNTIEQNSKGILGWAAIKVIGQLVYPTIKATVGLPDHLRTPLDLIKFEADGFLDNHRGQGVVPRKFIKAEEGEVIVEAPSPGYSCYLIEGVFDGILQMYKVRKGSVQQIQCVKKGDPTCTYHIKW